MYGALSAANRMKGIDFGFGEVDVNNVDGAIEALGITVWYLNMSDGLI